MPSIYYAWIFGHGIPNDTYLNDKLASFFRDYKYTRLKDYHSKFQLYQETKQKSVVLGQAKTKAIAYFTHTSR